MHDLPSLSGSYALFLWLPKNTRIRVGASGEAQFSAGYYIYLGSGRGPGGVRARLGRHLRGGTKMHWHIDYLRAVAQISAYAYLIDEAMGTIENPVECLWAQVLAKHPHYSVPFTGFGASDCRSGCPAHLLKWVQRSPVGMGAFRKLLAAALPCPPAFVRLETL